MQNEPNSGGNIIHVTELHHITSQLASFHVGITAAGHRQDRSPIPQYMYYTSEDNK